MNEKHETKETSKTGEPWLPIETKLVVWSVIGGIIALIVLAILVHIFLL
ncbi:MAG: hypothetical protein ABIJ56_15445 [Pseudomonadota bacterium]